MMASSSELEKANNALKTLTGRNKRKMFVMRRSRSKSKNLASRHRFNVRSTTAPCGGQKKGTVSLSSTQSTENGGVKSGLFSFDYKVVKYREGDDDNEFDPVLGPENMPKNARVVDVSAQVKQAERLEDESRSKKWSRNDKKPPVFPKTVLKEIQKMNVEKFGMKVVGNNEKRLELLCLEREMDDMEKRIVSKTKDRNSLMYLLELSNVVKNISAVLIEKEKTSCVPRATVLKKLFRLCERISSKSLNFYMKAKKRLRMKSEQHLQLLKDLEDIIFYVSQKNQQSFLYQKMIGNLKKKIDDGFWGRGGGGQKDATSGEGGSGTKKPTVLLSASAFTVKLAKITQTVMTSRDFEIKDQTIKNQKRRIMELEYKLKQSEEEKASMVEKLRLSQLKVRNLKMLKQKESSLLQELEIFNVQQQEKMVEIQEDIEDDEDDDESGRQKKRGMNMNPFEMTKVFHFGTQTDDGYDVEKVDQEMQTDGVMPSSQLGLRNSDSLIRSIAKLRQVNRGMQTKMVHRIGMEVQTDFTEWQNVDQRDQRREEVDEIGIDSPKLKQRKNSGLKRKTKKKKKKKQKGKKKKVVRKRKESLSVLERQMKKQSPSQHQGVPVLNAASAVAISGVENVEDEKLELVEERERYERENQLFENLDKMVTDVNFRPPPVVDAFTTGVDELVEKDLSNVDYYSKPSSPTLKRKKKKAGSGGGGVNRSRKRGVSTGITGGKKRGGVSKKRVMESVRGTIQSVAKQNIDLNNCLDKPISLLGIKPEKALPVKLLNKQILEIFMELAESELLTSIRDKKGLHKHIQNFYLRKYGLQSMADLKMGELVNNLKYHEKSERVLTFVNFFQLLHLIGMGSNNSDSEIYTISSLQVYLKVLKVTKSLITSRLIKDFETGMLTISMNFVYLVFQRCELSLHSEDMEYFFDLVESELSGNEQIKYDRMVTLLLKAYHNFEKCKTLVMSCSSGVSTASTGGGGSNNATQTQCSIGKFKKFIKQFFGRLYRFSDEHVIEPTPNIKQKDILKVYVETQNEISELINQDLNQSVKRKYSQAHTNLLVQIVSETDVEKALEFYKLFVQNLLKESSNVSHQNFAGLMNSMKFEQVL